MAIHEHPLRTLRTKLGLTQAAFAARVGMNAVYISQVETGVERLGRNAGLAIVDEFREAMLGAGISLEDLLRGFEESAA